MLGTDLAACCRASQMDVLGADLPQVDITRPDQLRQIVSASSFIINCAAYTNVDRAETEEDLATRINGHAVGTLGKLAAEAGIPVIHISTDFVFDGKLDRPYIETDRPHPINAYGRSKLEGERQLADSGCRYCIIRIQWTYGRAGINFVRKILEAARVRPALRVVEDQVGSPTATVEVAGALCRILQRDVFPEGIYHLAAEGFASRFEMARFLCQTKGIDVPIEPCKTADFPAPAQRPLNSRFSCEKILSILGQKMRPWQDPLRDYLEML